MSPATHQQMFPVVEITTGRIRGYSNTGVSIFRGIPYGEDTAASRFQPPRPRQPWTGVRDCFGPGPVAPQLPLPLTSIYSQLLHYEMTIADGGMSEDCLSLNVWSEGGVWSQGGRDGARRPVIVLLHGGGYAHSSGNSPFYDGAQLALDHDVVVVSINHRLGSFGYLGLAGLGLDERFDSAGHCGLLDLVLALQWLRDNAEVFGGDPARVTLVGESGGGWKVSALMAMPLARGLFHRAVVQSGSGPGFLSAEEGAALAQALLEKLGLSKRDADKLLSQDFTRQLAAQAQVGPAGPVSFLPVMHEAALPAQMLDPASLAVSREIPLIVSTTLDDAGLFFTHYDLDEAGLKALLTHQYGDLGNELHRLYRARRPDKSPYLLHAEIITDAGFRRYALAQARGKAALRAAPVWMYRWDWPSPAWDGRFGAAHAIDVSASLGHVRDSLLGGGVATGRRLSAVLSGALARFAATGSPVGGELPDWPSYSSADPTCLLLDETVAIARDPDRQFREFWETRPMSSSVAG